MLRPRSPIAQNDLVPTLLSESEGAIRAAFQLFDKEHQTLICQQAKELLVENVQEDLSAAKINLALMEEILAQ
ncbi:hypothetical protein [sulfur-oxidizing endosymbiont of Gigantopelta aegis]|uniref:hypothetical protein n=1 Tax=sulfur-oxidizing endosymbiont of Gigantopelta aegis TaxID=2794934 RepID=UPI0018DBF128|nr:hypothetical protein [sulfur-oxidizing endosymbiont of Gigantopelta aegis]